MTIIRPGVCFFKFLSSFKNELFLNCRIFVWLFFLIPYLFKSQSLSYKRNRPYFGSRYRVVQLALLLFFSAEKRDNLVNIKSCKQVRFQSNFSPFLCTLHQSGSVYLLPVLLYLKNPPSYLSQSDCKPRCQIGGRFASLQRKLLAVSLICDL